jgi:hypothetical protein
VRPPYAHASQARQVLNDAEDDLREWRLEGVFADDDKAVVTEGGNAPVAEKREEKGKMKEKEKGKENLKERERGEDGGGVSAKI